MNVGVAAGVAGIVLFASAMQALSGFGFALMAVPLLSLLIAPKDAVVIASMISLATTGLVSWRGRHSADGPLARRLIVASLCGAPFGLMVISFARAEVLRLILGVVVLTAVAALLRGVRVRESRAHDAVLGFVSGVLSTSLSTNGPPLVFLLQSRAMAPDRFRATINQVFVVANVVALSLFATAGLVSTGVVEASIAALPAAAVGVQIGTRLRARVSPERFRHVVLALLTLSGISAIVGAVGSLVQ